MKSPSTFWSGRGPGDSLQSVPFDVDAAFRHPLSPTEVRKQANHYERCRNQMSKPTTVDRLPTKLFFLREGPLRGLFLQSETHRVRQEPRPSVAALEREMREMPGRNYCCDRTSAGLTLANKLFEHAHFHHTHINPARECLCFHVQNTSIGVYWYSFPSQINFAKFCVRLFAPSEVGGPKAATAICRTTGSGRQPTTATISTRYNV